MTTPPIDWDTYPYHIGEGAISLRSWITTGEQIADDPYEYQHECFVHIDDIDDIIRAWCLANAIDPSRYFGITDSAKETA